MENVRFFYVTARYRPRRIAFVMDCSESNADEILDAIVSFNIDVWGGRFNPIIVMHGGELPPKEWDLLRAYDPDFVYVFGEMARSTVRRIAQLIQPIRFAEHGQFVAGRTRVEIDGQISTYEAIPRIAKRRGLWGQPDHLSILDLHAKTGGTRSRFLQRNFGISFNAHSCINREEVHGVSLDKDVNDAEVLQKVADNPRLLTAMEACAYAPAPAQFKSPEKGDAVIFYGDDPLTFRDFWNWSLFGRGYLGWQNCVRSIWIPTNLLSDPNLSNAFVYLLTKRAFSQGGQSRISFLSRTHSDEELKSLALNLSANVRTKLVPHVTRQLTELDFVAELEQRAEGGWPIDQHYYVAGSALNLDVSTPEIIASENQNGCFMADLWIEDPIQERVYASSSLPWWRLPQRSGVPSLFAVRQPSRVNREGHISVEITQQTKTVFIRVPSHEEVIESALQNEVHAMMTADLRNRLVPTFHDIWFRLSDKGRYFRGVLSLLGGIQNTYLFFDHPIWMRFAAELSQRTVDKNLTSWVIQRLQSLKTKNVVEADALHLIEHVIRQVPRQRLAANFKHIRGWAAAELGSLNEEGQRHFFQNLRVSKGLQEIDDSAVLDRYIVDAVSELLERVS